MLKITNDEELAQFFLENVPELKPVFDERYQFMNEIVGCLFLGGFAVYTVRAFVKLIEAAENIEKEAQVVQRIFDCVEEAFIYGDKGIKNILTSCFLEELIKNNPHYDRIKDYMKPISIVELDRIDRFWAGEIISDESA